MAARWLTIRIDLLGGRGEVLDAPAGRIMLVGPAHTFEQLADAINTAFARWDPAHLHVFELSDGRSIGYPDEDAEDLAWLDHAALKVADVLAPGEEFRYVFDLGDGWEHRCVVQPDRVDPRAICGEAPRRPLAIEGWGWIPDQYGRDSFDVDLEEE